VLRSVAPCWGSYTVAHTYSSTPRGHASGSFWMLSIARLISSSSDTPSVMAAAATSVTGSAVSARLTRSDALLSPTNEYRRIILP